MPQTICEGAEVSAFSLFCAKLLAIDGCRTPVLDLPSSAKPRFLPGLSWVLQVGLVF
jgi:hypothetical protein